MKKNTPIITKTDIKIMRMTIPAGTRMIYIESIPDGSSIIAHYPEAKISIGLSYHEWGRIKNSK